MKEIRILSPISRGFLWITSTNEIRRTRIKIEQEYRTLRSLLGRSPGTRSIKIVIVFDQPAMSFGYGDSLVVLMLAKYICDLGYSVELRCIPSSKPNAVSIERLCKNVQLPLSIVVAGGAGYSRSAGGEHILFNSDVDAGRDISRFCLTLVSKIYKSRTLNPLSIRPILMPVSGNHLRHEESDRTTRLRIGMSVRNQKYSTFRNPPEDTVLLDVLSVCINFPVSDIVWFGDKEQFSRVFVQVQSELLRRECALVYQNSTDYYSAIEEALACDAWIQRLGGGMSVPIIFGQKPYAIITNDIGAIKLFDYSRKKVVSWASAEQRYVPRIFSPLGSLQREMRRLRKNLERKRHLNR